MDCRDQCWAWGLTAAYLVGGIVWCALVFPGLPADEPPHFNIVQYYSHLQGMPVMNQGGISHEACQPPLYYFLFGILYRIFIAGGLRFAFYALRIATLASAAPLVYLIYRAAREFSGWRNVAQLAAVLFAMNPSILSITASVQNDSLLFLLSTLAAYLCIRWTVARQLSYGRVVIVSLLVAAAVLTKTPALVLIPFVAMIVLFVYRWQGIPRLAVFALILLATTGWWFARNQRLYHDWTGAASVAGLFGHDGQFQPFSIGSWLWAASSLITYYTVPVEYWRDFVHASKLIKIAAAAGTAIVIVGLAIGMIRRRFPRSSGDWWVIFAIAGCAFWMTVSIRNFYVPARVGMVGCAGLIFILAGSINEVRVFVARYAPSRRLARHWPIALAGFLAVGQAFFLIKVVQIPNPPDFIHLASDNGSAR